MLFECTHCLNKFSICDERKLDMHRGVNMWEAFCSRLFVSCLACPIVGTSTPYSVATVLLRVFCVFRQNIRSLAAVISSAFALLTIHVAHSQLMLMYSADYFVTSQIWDYSISQTELETIFMSFAKNQEEEVTIVPGVRYADAEGGAASRNSTGDSDHVTGGGGRSGLAPPRSPRSMDVEMGSLRGTRSRVGGGSSDEAWVDHGESASLV